MDNTPKLTHQQIFSRAVLGVVRQGRLSRDESHICLYRLGDGARIACGVGHNIADEYYDSRCEGEAASTDLMESISRADGDSDRSFLLAMSLCASGVDATDKRTLQLLDEIQKAHDQAPNVANFIEHARDVANRRGLKFPAISGISAQRGY